MMPRKVSGKPKKEPVAQTENVNKHEILSEDDECDEEDETLSDSYEEEEISCGNNDNNESERHEQRPSGPTREILLHKMREKERILDEKEEMTYFMSNEIDKLKHEAMKADLKIQDMEANLINEKRRK